MASFKFHLTALPGHVGIVSDPRVAQQIGKPLRHQDPDLFYRAAQFQDAHVQTRLGPLDAVSVVEYLLLEGTERSRRTRSTKFSFSHTKR